MVERNRLQEGLGRQTGPAGEQFLQAGRGLADLLGQNLQRGLVAIVEADLLDGAADHLIVAAFGRDVVLKDRGRFHAGIHGHLGVHGNISLTANIVLPALCHHPKLAFPPPIPR